MWACSTAQWSNDSGEETSRVALPRSADVWRGRNHEPYLRQFWQNLLLYVSVADLVQSPSYANDAAAAAGGVEIGQEYRNGSVRQARVV